MTVVATVVSEEQLTAAHMALALHAHIHIYRYDGIYIPLSLVLAHACILLHVHIYRYAGDCTSFRLLAGSTSAYRLFASVRGCSS